MTGGESQRMALSGPPRQPSDRATVASWSDGMCRATAGKQQPDFASTAHAAEPEGRTSYPVTALRTSTSGPACHISVICCTNAQRVLLSLPWRLRS